MASNAPIRIALAIHELHDHGGLQRDAVRVGREAVARGHAVTFLLARTPPAALDLGGAGARVLAVRGRSNHARAAAFSRAVEAVSGEYDVVLGFHGGAGLDLCFAGDRCYVERIASTRTPLVRATARYRVLRGLERAVFGPRSRTTALLLAPTHADVYRKWYGTPDARMEVLPPGIDPSRRRGEDHAEVRRAVRDELAVAAREPLALLVGSDFARKGLDRAVDALGELSRRGVAVVLAVAGADDGRRFMARARRRGLSTGAGPGPRLTLLGARADVPRLLVAADVLVHPARTEAAGAVLLEALAAGTPVVASSACGYAPWIAASGAGAVLDGEAGSAAWAEALAEVLRAPKGELSDAALRFVDAHPELFTMHARVVDAIERAASRTRAEGARP